jgi:hypothetical protein
MRQYEQLGENKTGRTQRSGDVVGGPFSTEFYRKLHSVIHKEFRAQSLEVPHSGKPNGFEPRRCRMAPRRRTETQRLKTP